MAVIFLSLSHAAKFHNAGLFVSFSSSSCEEKIFLYILCNIIILYCNSNCYPLCVRIHGGIQVFNCKKNNEINTTVYIIKANIIIM